MTLSFVRLAGLWIVFTALVLFLQWSGGAFVGSFSGHPDEGAHFVTGLMVRDYLVAGIPEHPMRFAENYYNHYPKVALGHYPPGFYLVEGLWLTVFPVGRVSVLVLMASLAGAFALMIYVCARRAKFALSAAVVMALVVIGLPLTQSLASTVMADILLGLLVVAACLAFIRFLESEKWIDSFGFGLLAAAAAMTKGSGLLLALLPGMAIVLGGRYRLLKKWSLWVAVLPVLLVCGPWFWFSSSITAEGMGDSGVFEHFKQALPYFGSQFVRTFGYSIVIPALVGCVWVVSRREIRSDPFWSVMLILPLALMLFHGLIPAGLEARYLLPAVPMVLFLAAAGVRWSVSRIVVRYRFAASLGLTALILGLFVMEVSPPNMAGGGGYRIAAEQLVTDGLDEPKRFLISSDARGEGAFISEIAILDSSRPSHTVDRCSKVLASSDWLGRGYVESFGSDVELRQYLAETGYDGVLLDEEIPEIFIQPHHVRLSRVMKSSSIFSLMDRATPLTQGRGSANSIFLRNPAAD